MFVVRHRAAGSYLETVHGCGVLWCESLARAYRFLSAEDAFTTAYLTCIGTDPSDLTVKELVVGRTFVAELPA